ncbi:MAG: SDR family oxidoreductase [Lachnospiraceae bacterium]|nr:SDR family oxidoreductase [Lachnospiraceae bacterium]
MKTVVITGSARGLGYEMAKQFRANGWNVVISDINEENLKKAKETLSALHGTGKVETCVYDVTKYDQVEALLAFALEKFENVDIWISNAGVNQPNKAVYELTPSEIELMLNVDLKGAIFGCKVAYARMREQGFGQIYAIDGYGSNDAKMLGLSLYGTSKRGLTYFMQALAKEAKTLGDNIQVGRLSPGIMITDFLVNANNDSTKVELSEKTKKVYNILGDYPDVIAEFLVKKMLTNTKNDVVFEWLTNGKAFKRFLTAGFNKRDFFSEKKA